MNQFIKKDWYSILMYLIMGGLTTFVNIIIYWVADDRLLLDYRIATVIAWIFAVVFAYFVNKRYVFKSVTRNWNERFSEIASFFGFRFLSLFMDLGVMLILVGILDLNGTVSKVLANVVVLVANYIFSKKFIFKNREVSLVD